MFGNKMSRSGLGRRKTVRFLALFVTAVMLFTSLGITALAGDAIDLDKACSIELKLTKAEYGDGSDGSENVFETPTVIADVYKVADAEEATMADDGYQITLADGFDGFLGYKKGELIDIKQDWTGADQKAVAMVSDGSKNPTKSSAESTGESVKVEDLEAGLYLVVIHGDMDNYFKEIDNPDYDPETDPEEAKTKIVSIGNSKHYEFQFDPQLIALPAKEAHDGIFDTLDPGDWIYDLVADTKAGFEERKGKIKITKELLGYNPEYKATFVFDVEVMEEGETVPYLSQVYTLDFNACGIKHIIIDELPVDAAVTVTEKYSGSGYKLVGEVQPEDNKVKADEVIEFSFQNDFSKTLKGGGGMLNKFVFNGESWDWDNTHDSETTETEE